MCMRIVYQVGCGTGDASRLLLERFPAAKIVLLDNSQTRLAQAQQDPALGNRALVSFACEDADTHFPSDAAASSTSSSSPGGGGGGADNHNVDYDLVFSNASIHWTFDVAGLLPRLLRRVRPGGTLALQVPDMSSQPSHALFRETAEELGINHKAIRLPLLRLPSSERDVAGYAERLLGPMCSSIDMWSTTYVHALSGEDAVFNFVKNTYDGQQALHQSFLDGGRGPPDADADASPSVAAPADGQSHKLLATEQAAAFEELYRQKVSAAYPPCAAGDGKSVTLYPFTRFFLVARRPTVLEQLEMASTSRRSSS